MLNSNWNDALDIIILSIISKVVVDVLSDTIKRALKFTFIKTEKDLIIWTHVRKRRLKKGHIPRTPKECIDGKCVEV